MKKKCAALLALVLLVLVAALQASEKDKTGRPILKVKINYAGAGTVDQKHKIFVLLFDANPFTASTLIDSTAATTPPTPATGVSHILRRLSATAKNETLTFIDLSTTPVYAAAFLDQNSSYDGRSDPVSGAPMGVYIRAPSKVEPIALEDGKTVEIVLSFDDSTKTP